MFCFFFFFFWTDNIAVYYSYQINKQCYGEITRMKSLGRHIQHFMTTIIPYCHIENLQNKCLSVQDDRAHELEKKKHCV
uniref:Putative secreted protein n=1 Tax=Rhipicephalus microplus TaxID=6941 RepID=A0A6M2DDS3_RHIMP